MFSKKISRRSFLKVSAVTTAMAAMGLPAFAAEDTAEENCFQTLNIPRATGSTVDKSVLLNESRLYLITDFGAVSEGDPVQNTKAINAAIQAASEAGGGTVVVPAGDFKSYTIRLQSGVNLRIDANGIIRAARADLYDWYGNQTMVGEGGNYDEPEVNLYAGLQDHGHTYFANSLFYAADKHDIMIYGRASSTAATWTTLAPSSMCCPATTPPTPKTAPTGATAPPGTATRPLHWCAARMWCWTASAS